MVPHHAGGKDPHGARRMKYGPAGDLREELKLLSAYVSYLK